MNRDGHKDVVFFIGPEVEKTPAADKKTLFVVGKPELDHIMLMANEYKTPHIFMGANHSFTVDESNLYWDAIITALLDKGFWVTLDYQAHEHAHVRKMLNAGIWQSRLFIPLLGVRIPDIETSNVNLTVKIDDIDFNATNPGVWCLHYHELLDSNRFTGWQEYNTDEIVAPMSGPVPTPVLQMKAPVKDTKIEAQSIDAIKEPVLEGVEKNQTELGLDIDSPSQLKPDSDDEKIAKALDAIESTSAAEAYAEGAKEDPLGKTESKKSASKKSKTV